MEMKPDIRFAVAAALLLGCSAGDLAFAQQQGGILRIPHFDSPASMSLHEESTIAANRPLMGVFNNLVMFDQHAPQNSPRSIVPDLATSWSWNEEGTELTLPLRPRGQMARRQTFHRQRCQMHLGIADREVEREAPHQSP
jgi:ABC-type transport system substrate-binding protein